jgi:6-phosphofructokinase 1
MSLVSGRDRQDAELVGREGVRALMAGESDKMVALCPLEGEEEGTVKLVPLSEAGSGHRAIPAEWLSKDPLAVGTAFRDYVRPLVGELSYYSHPLSSR